MKKLVIWFLCIAMLWQSSINVYAEDIEMAIQQFQTDAMIEEETMTETDEEQIEENKESEGDQTVEDTEEPQPEEGKEEPEGEQPEEDKEESEEAQPEESMGEPEGAQPEENEEEADKELIEDSEEQTVEEQESAEEIETEENEEEDYEDPQYGREHGDLEEGFWGVQTFSEKSGYVHADKFSNHIIHDVIDVSKYQGDIDWTQVKRSGIDYAFIRVGFRGYGQSGSLNTDNKFKENIQNATKAGMKVGVYFFSQAITEDEAKEEAEYVLSRIKDYEISLPVVIDFEYASSGSGLTGRLYHANLSKGRATRICQRFCEIVENKGYTGMVYANRNMLENGVNASEIAEDYKIWLANYGTSTSYAGKYEFWQYTQSGTVNGISGNVDKSFWYEEPEVNVNYAKMPEGIYTIASCLDKSKVIDIPGASAANGVNPQIYTGNQTWAQKFYVRPDSNGAYMIMSANSGKVLTADGKSITQKDYTGEENQQWRFILNADGSYTIQSKKTRTVMDVTGGKTANGTKIQLYQSNRTKAQCFLMGAENGQSLQDVEDGVYIIETALQGNKVLGVKNSGKNLELQSLNITDQQKFKIQYTGSGIYQVTSVMNQKMLLSKDGTQVLLDNVSSSTLEQQWLIKKNKTGTYTIISVKDGKNLDIAGAKTAVGTGIQKYTGNGTKAQQFYLYEESLFENLPEDGIYIIHSALNDASVLDISGKSKRCNANVQLYTENGTDAQKFIVKRLENGNYQILSYYSQMAVAVENNKNANSTNVCQWFPTGGSTQEWMIVPKAEGYYSVISATGDKVLDAKGGKSADRTNIQTYTANGSNAQKFRFEKVGEIDNPIIKEQKIEDGTYTICSALNEAEVLDVSGGSLYSGANIQLYTSNNSSAQQFVIQKDLDNELYTITSKKSGMGVTYKDGILKNSTNVYQDAKFGEEGTYWRLRHIVDDYYMIYTAESEFCMDVSAAKTADKTNIQIYTANGSKAQIFKLKKINDQTTVEQNVRLELKEGLYTIAPSLNSSMVLDVAGASTSDGANIQLYKGNNTRAQKYFVRKLENGNYTMTVLCSDKMVTVDGANVCQAEKIGTKAQEWNMIPAGNGYYTIVSLQNGKVLDVKSGKTSNGTNIQIYTSNYTAAQRFKFTQTTTTAEAKFMSDENNGFRLNYELYAKGNEASADNNYYLMQADCYSGKIFGSPLTSVEKNFEVSINLNISDRSKLKELAIDKLVLAVKNNDGTYKEVTSAVSVSNPEAIANNTAKIFKASSKKGLQGVAYASDGTQPVDARYTNSKQTMLNLDLAEIINPKSDYTTFTYKGKQYRFSKCSALIANIRSLNAGYQQYLYGNNGTTKASVSLCLLLSYDSSNSYLIDPSARKAGHSYYLLNVREQKARETLEAAFVYLGEIFGQEDCYVTNWILGNEINSSKAWNYGGSLNFDTYMQCYTTAFRMLYNAVKSEKTGNTVSISLDNGWTAIPDTYAGKATLDTFAKNINAENPNIDWSISYHAYSYPLTRADFWNDSSNTTNSTSTRYISMQNMNVLTNYAASLEKSYQKSPGSIRVLLTEVGYSYGAGAENQARAIARGYYVAEFNDRIDAFIIRAIVDDAEEAKGKLYFGLMNSQQEKRTAFYVYEYMDSDLNQLKNTFPSGLVSSANYGKFNSAKNILCNTNWKSVVPGFDASKLAGIN